MKHKSKVKDYLLYFIVFVIAVSVSMNFNLLDKKADYVYADYPPTTGMNIVQYALYWTTDASGRAHIPYVYGGPGRGHSLEECRQRDLGTDCSGFVQAVYNHYGISVPGTSAAMKSGSPYTVSFNSTATIDYSQVNIGDIVWWSGHVALYIGDHKIVHTNTSKTTPPGANLIHVQSLDNYRGNEKCAFLRYANGFGVSVDDAANGMTDDDIDSVDSEDTQNHVITAKPTGLLVCESDLTGMPLEWTEALEAQVTPPLLSRDDLSVTDSESLSQIEERLNAKENFYLTMRTIIVCVGIVIMLYGVAILVAYIFDKTNSFIDISLLNVLTFNKVYLIEDKSDITKETKGKVYVTKSGLFTRVLIIEAIGFLLLSGMVYRCIVFIISKFM